MIYTVLSLVIFIQAAMIVGLVVTMVRQQNSLFRAAMSRTPGEYRKLEQAAAQKPTTPNPKSTFDEATALVLESVTSSGEARVPMPHGLGGN